MILGSVIRQAPNRLVFNTEDIYLSPLVTKSTAYLGARLTGQPNLFDTLDKSQHSRKRRAIGKALSEKSMQSFEPTMICQIDVFLRQLLRSSQEDDTVNMSPICQRLGGDIVGHLAFGYPLNTQTDPTNRPLLAAMATINARISLYMNWPATSVILDPLIRWLGRKRGADFRRSIQTMVRARMAMDKDAQHDLYSIALSDKAAEVNDESDDGLRGSQLWSEAVFFITAGGTTTSTTMSAAFFYLSRRPAAYKRLATEIRTTFSSGRDIRNGPQLKSCEYLRAVIDETLRIAPASLGILWRQQDTSSPSNAGKPFIVDGHVIPPGTSVGISLYSLLHNETYFEEPFEFRPERWLVPKDGSETPEQQEARALMHRAHAPFALGDRGCAGKAMAYLEVSLTLAKTVWYFDFEKAPGEAGELGGGGYGGVSGGRGRKEEFQLYDVATADHDGPLLKFSPRVEVLGDLGGAADEGTPSFRRFIMNPRAPSDASRARPSEPPTAPPITTELSFGQSLSAAAAVSFASCVVPAEIDEVTVTVAAPVVLISVAVAETRSIPMFVVMRAVVFEQQFVSCSGAGRQQYTPGWHWSTFQAQVLEPPPHCVVSIIKRSG
ncbi:hypothetical protein VMCG_00878 [Cytospora schulzeri]|uniref:Uncharacterized protein n=1 Tax=Cytospora schulzeri TaxID=448051 RepID=A0A423X4U5_9PEZI|nr:hypothetical protein VMCG_00878 [Valsa malicola]